jgi:hypothetical protein
MSAEEKIIKLKLEAMRQLRIRMYAPHSVAPHELLGYFDKTLNAVLGPALSELSQALQWRGTAEKLAAELNTEHRERIEAEESLDVLGHELQAVKDVLAEDGLL